MFDIDALWPARRARGEDTISKIGWVHPWKAWPWLLGSIRAKVLDDDANGGRRLDVLFEFSRCQGDLDIGLAYDGADARGRIDRIEWDIGAARLEDGEHGNDVLQRPVEIDRDRSFWRDAGADEPPGQIVDTRHELPIGDGAVLKAHRDGVWSS